jgi:hypothetical protein
MIYLKLSTPFNPGAYDAGNTYPHCLVTLFNMNVPAAAIEIRYEYGTFDAATGWTPGKANFPQITNLQNDEFYEAITAMPSGDNDSVLMAAARACYDVLIEKGLVVGTITETDIAAPAPGSVDDAGATADSSGATGATASDA